MDTIIELYSRQDLERLKKKTKRAGRAALLIAAATLAVCVLLCCLADRHSLALMEKIVTAVSVLGGWTVIYLYHHLVKERRWELGHAQMLLEGERSVLEGVIEVSKERMRIRGSIRFFPIALTDGEERRRSKVIAERAERLRAENGKKLRLYVVNGYVAAYEQI